MAAIQGPMLAALKKKLEEQYVPYLPLLLTNGNDEDKRKKQVSRSFSAFVLHALFDLDPKSAAESVVDDQGDNGLDAIYYQKETETLYLLQSKLRETQQFTLGEAQRFTHGGRLLVDQQFSEFNQHVQDRENEIIDALDECESIKLVVAYVGDGISRPAKLALENFVRDDSLEEERISEDVQYFTAEHTEAALRTEYSVKPVNTRIKLNKSGTVGQPRKTIIGLARLQDLVGLHKEFGKALYEKNIRYFLGAGRRGVNRAIKSTLEHHPADFFYLNNGITAVCSSIKPKRSQGGYKDYQLAGLSVINGAQTIASAAQFLDENPDSDISTARVMMTLIQAKDDGYFHKEVTRSRNLQNPVDLSHFAALDDKQEKLRQEMALYNVRYIYRPEQVRQRMQMMIKLDELAKALACIAKDNRFPARLKSEPSQFVDIDGEMYKELFTDDLTGAKVINVVKVYRKSMVLLKKAEISNSSPERLIYRHCGYALTGILIKCFKRQIEAGEILNDEKLAVDISQPFDEIRQLFADKYLAIYTGSAPYAVFKRIGDTSTLMNKVLAEYLVRTDDDHVKNLNNTLMIDDVFKQKLTNYLCGKIKQI